MTNYQEKLIIRPVDRQSQITHYLVKYLDSDTLEWIDEHCMGSGIMYDYHNLKREHFARQKQAFTTTLLLEISY
jgi:hypothetical protein